LSGEYREAVEKSPPLFTFVAYNIVERSHFHGFLTGLRNSWIGNWWSNWWIICWQPLLAINQSIFVVLFYRLTFLIDGFCIICSKLGLEFWGKRRKNKFGNDKEKERIGLNYWAECLSLFNSDSRKNYWASVPKNLISLQWWLSCLEGEKKTKKLIKSRKLKKNNWKNWKKKPD